MSSHSLHFMRIMVMYNLAGTFCAQSLSRLAQQRLSNRALTASGRSDTLQSNQNLPFPTFGYPPPQTSFSCSNVRQPGFYADHETGCQVIRRCTIENFMFSYICPNVTLFDEVSQSCDYWFNVRCPSSRAISIGFDPTFQMAADDSPTFANLIMDRSATLPLFPKSLGIGFPGSSSMGDSVDTLLQWVGADSSKTPVTLQKNGSENRSKKVLHNPHTAKTNSRFPKRKNASIHKVLPSRQPERKDDPSVKSISLPPPKGFLAPNQLGTDWIPLAAFR